MELRLNSASVEIEVEVEVEAELGKNKLGLSCANSAKLMLGKN